MLNKLLGRQNKSFSDRAGGPLELSSAREHIREIEKEVRQARLRMNSNYDRSLSMCTSMHNTLHVAHRHDGVKRGM
jgi:hypothetical protein